MAETELRVQLFWHPAGAVALLRQVDLVAGATLADAVEASGLAALLPDSSWRDADGALRLAVFGQLRQAHELVHDGDRIDVLRGLRVDPKQARRLRAGRRRP